MKQKVSIACKGSAEASVHDLEPFQGELKTLSKNDYGKLKKEILELGFSEPISVWKKDGHLRILNGHQRVRTLIQMKQEGFEIPDRVPINLVEAKDEKEAKRKVLSLTSQYGEITSDGLYEFMHEAKMGLDELVSSFRFPEIDFRKFEAEFFAEKEEDSPIPEKPKNPITQSGDLWELGDHRVLCGDSTDAKSVDVVLGGGAPFLMVTDPPYGVEYDPKWREQNLDTWKKPRSTGKVQNDDQVDWSKAFQLFSGDVVYCWHAGKFASDVAQHLNATGFEIRSQIIWRKQHFVISRGDYHWGHEPCWYAVRKGKKSLWCGDRDQSTIWDIKNASAMGGENQDDQTGHGTQKPTECMARPIRNHGKETESVYDPFLGSGTTLIAAEKIGRKSFGLEIDPGYCDVIVQRFEQVTGKKAKRIKNAAT